MGFDIHGRHPTGDEGKHFRRSTLAWPPLTALCRELVPEVSKDCTYWTSNDGDDRLSPMRCARLKRIPVFVAVIVVSEFRGVTLRSSSLVGTHFILEFEVGAFALSSDSEKFHQKLLLERPHWTDDHDKPQGLWCFDNIISGLPCVSSDSADAWETIITRLHATEDFRDEKLFFRFAGLRPLKAETDLKLAQTEYSLGSGKNYQFSVYHFHPDGDRAVMAAGNTMIKVQVSNPLIEMISTPSLPIDSPYDLKVFRFHTAVTTGSQYGLITC